MRYLYLIVSIALIAILAAAVWTGRGPHTPDYVSLSPGANPHLMTSRGARTASPTPLLPEFTTEKDVESSFDGTRLLFSGKRTADGRWEIWECKPDGSELSEITTIDADCDEPHYLPDGHIVFRRTILAGSTLCTVKDKKIDQITFNRDPIGGTVILPDGRILAQLGNSTVTINSDGTGVALFTGTDEDIADARAQVADALSPVRPRQMPTGHVSVIDAKKRPFSLLFCLNTYLSNRNGISSLPDGAIAKVRVWVADPTPRIAADAPVDSDGSFYLQVPADVPMRFSTLDREGHVIGDQTTWIWTRANESRGCIGCHESPGLSPENLVAMATRRPATKVALASLPGKPLK